mgnify:CR=1 FL=1
MVVTQVVPGVIGTWSEVGFVEAAGAAPWCGAVGPAATRLFHRTGCCSGSSGVIEDVDAHGLAVGIKS